MTYDHLPAKDGLNEEIVKLLTSYFSQRGTFLSQVILADLKSSAYGQQIKVEGSNGNGKKQPPRQVLTANQGNGLASPVRAAAKNIDFSYIHSIEQNSGRQPNTVVSPSPAPAQNLENELIQLAAQQTGFPENSISLDAKLLDDLNLDSIKGGELIAEFAKKCGVAGIVDATALANSSLGEILGAVRAVIPASKAPVADAVQSKNQTIAAMMLELVAQYTGFPPESLSLDLRLLDDLNLDSIKAADLMATAAKRAGVQKDLNPSTLANATLGEVIAALEQTQSQARPLDVPILPSPSPQQLNWVRNFAIEYVPQSSLSGEPADWSQAQVLMVCDHKEDLLVQEISQQLSQAGAIVQVYSYAQLLANPVATDFSDCIAILPRTTSPETFLPLSEMVSRLRSIATLNTSANLAYVQFGGGYFGGGNISEPPEVCCAAGFARSVHLERPDVKVRVIDLDKNIPPDQSAPLVISELESPPSIVTVGYDARRVRLVPQSRLQQPVDYPSRKLSWSSEDVILVSGGAKGITAECAIALGEKSGVKMALVGRSAPSGEVTQTLNRFQSLGLTCRYYTCDIADSESVHNLVHQVAQDLGQITGVIHGAGLNQPRRAEQVSREAAMAEVSPKLLGAHNLLEALSDHPPKLFLAFSSIIGVTGMPGNAWYAFANESLAILLSHFQARHPETQTISLAYSIWDEIGMGAKLGSIKHLQKMGISAISPSEGLSRFLQLWEGDGGVSQVVIAARLGGLDTWTPRPGPKISGLRFIEQVLSIEPGVELQARAHLSLERDLYIGDHLWRGSYLFPTVFGLEAMAQAVAYLTGHTKLPIVGIADISLRRPIVVDEIKGVTIEIQATLLEVDASGEQRVKVGIRTEQTDFSSDHFSATLILGELKPPEKVPTQLGKALSIEPKTDLYGDLLFQGPRFQRMGTIYSLDEKGSVFRSHANLSVTELLQESFAPAAGEYLLLGDPYLRDVLLQSVQLTIPQDICLPVEIGQIEFFAPAANDTGERIVNVFLLAREGREYISKVIATDARGNVLEQLTGYRLRILEEHPQNPTALELAAPEARDAQRLEGELQQIFQAWGLSAPAITLGYAPNLGTLPKKQRRLQEQAIVARALTTQLGFREEVDFQIQSLASGKPQFKGTETAALDLSLSHCARYCLSSVGENPQGCDIEAITYRSPEDWLALLGLKHGAVLEQLVQQGDSYEQAGTRIWSAIEAVRKAFNSCQPAFSIAKRSGRAVLLQTSTEAGEYWAVTLAIELTRPPERMVAIVLPADKPEVQAIAKPEAHSSRYTDDGPEGQLVYEQRFQVSFKESGSISRHVYFSQYFRWIGKIRELPMESIAPQILKDFTGGDWGMVTNAVSLRVLGEATAYDIIQARAWVGNVVASSFDTYIEFCKVLPNGSLERIALAEVKATWVRLVSYGVPSPMAFPDYLQSYLERFAARVPASLDLKKPATWPLSPLPTSLFPLDLGNLLYQSPTSENRYGRWLWSEVYATTLEESNLVGNVYYGNYFIWQGRILDRFLYEVAPDYLRVSSPRGEIVCLYSRMDYLREAMPFDRIEARLYVQSVWERGALFCFEFFRQLPDGSSEKLHVGQQEVAWVMRDENGRAKAVEWPAEILSALVQLVAV